jgi:hypothetical protein
MIKPVMQILRNQTKGRVLNGGIGKQCRQKFHHCANTTRRAFGLAVGGSFIFSRMLPDLPASFDTPLFSAEMGPDFSRLICLQGFIVVTKQQQEIMVQQLVAQIGSVKKDMVILEKSEFTMLRNETEKQTAEIKQMKSLIKDEISKLQGNVKLDVNLERSRAVEAHAENEKQLQCKLTLL